MKSRDYWRKRSVDIVARQNKKADSYIIELEKQYKKALNSIQKDLEVFYSRYANAEGVDLVTARKLLTNAEKEVWEVSLEEYKKMALDDQFKEQIESMYSKSRVSRLQALQTQIRANIEALHSIVLQDGINLLEDTFTDTYYRNVYEIKKGTGIATNFARFNEDAVAQIVSKPWKHGSFSSNWDDCKRNLLDELETTLIQAFIRGDNMDKVIKIFSKRMDVDKRRAARIVLTEHSYIANQASFMSYKETGVEKYEYLATLDLHTSTICQSMDGKVFKLSEMMVGINYPPLHPWCRSTTIPYFDDLDAWIDERASRDPVTGKTENVLGDTKYPQWYKENVVEAQKLDDWIKTDEKVKDNRYSNQTNKAYYYSNVQWEKYIDITEECRDSLNNVHTKLSKFALNNNKEKVVLLDIEDNKIIYELSGEHNEVKFDDKLKTFLNNAKDKSIVLTHNHPSTTTFSEVDIQKLLKYKSIKAMTLECIDGSKYLIDASKYGYNSIDNFFYPNKYSSIYNSMLEKFPEVNNPKTIEDVWNEFKHQITIEVCNKYNLVYKKVK